MIVWHGGVDGFFRGFLGRFQGSLVGQLEPQVWKLFPSSTGTPVLHLVFWA